ncbi:tetratricopeptide repeat protein [Anabaena azotica]|uniref:Tetratricopeptide repeat protein n=1 Tax=Anabaena azotica FACHB-119 TaxID=947527 RepID=A0ABR8D9H7_9NOST|nr:tetratricopeptide repeat protein [Anabaena azotica]MBD2503231.1 tetratricopeptide repeat protein [Anabaena azotica FACHB-119]
MKDTFLSRFTPSLMTPQALEDIFVQRQELAKYIVELIRESVLTPSKYYTLLIGPRGIGKTHFVSLVYHRVCKMDDLQPSLLIAWLREEEWGVTSFLDLLLRIFRALLEEYRDENKLLPGLVQKVEALYQMSPEIAQKTAAAILKEVIGNRTLLLMMENLDEIFVGLGEEGQLQLRGFLQENSCCTILATSQSLFNGVKLQTSPFYGFFRIRYLMDLTAEEATELLGNIAKLEGKTDLEDFIHTPRGCDRIRAVHHLAGGSPRLYVIFSEFLTRQSLEELQEPFMGMLDDLTPYYQSRMQWLSPQQRKIVEILSDCRFALSVKYIAQRCFISHQTASSQLKDLREKGYVNSEAIGRESFYELQEPLMRFCLEVKKQRGEPIRLFIDFLRLWYTREELQQRLGLGFNDTRRNEIGNAADSNFSQALINDFSQEKNYGKYPQILEPLPPDAVVDREYILKALEAMEEDGEENPIFVAYRQECKNLIDNKDYLGALQYAEKLTEKRGQVQDWVLKADCLNGLERYEDTLVALSKAIELDPNDAWAWAIRGNVLDNLNRYEEALASCDKAIELDPNDTWAWAIRGNVLDNLNRYEEALASCDKAIELDPSDAWAWARRGNALGNLKLYEEALASCNKAIELNPNYAWAWVNRAWLLDNLKRHEEALASCNKAIELHPNYAWAWTRRGNALGNLKRYEEALASCDKAIELHPNYAWAWVNRAWVMENLNRYQEALASCDQAIKLNPHHAWAWARRGNVLGNLKRYEEALASCDKAIELDPNDAWAWVRRGNTFGNLKHYEEALASCDKAIEIDPNYAWAWAVRGHALSHVKRDEEALASCDKAIELHPNDELAWASRGNALGNLKRYEEALASYNKAIELDTNNELAWLDRSWTLINLERYQQALESCDQIISFGERDDCVLTNRAISLMGLQRWEEGVTAMEDALQNLEEGEEASTEDTEIICRILFANTQDALTWKTLIKILLELFSKYQVIPALSQGLVRSIPALMSEKVSDEVVQLWLEVWQELAGGLAGCQIALGLLNAAVRYRLTKGDRRTLLELPIEQRNLLKPLLGLE